MSVFPSPSDHAEMPHRMVGRQMVRRCSCGAPWPCERSAPGRWAALRLEIQGLRAIHYDHANDLADEGKDAERVFGRVDAYDYILTRMDREDGT